MWLAAARATGVSPRDAVVFDNSLGNCNGASDLLGYLGDEHVNRLERDLFYHPASEFVPEVDGRRPLFDIGENFRAVIGITNGSGSLEPWQEWMDESQGHRTRCSSIGGNATTRGLFKELTQIKV